MSNLDLRIGGRDYTVACAVGEEAHVSALGRLIDSKVQSLGSSVGTSETRQLLFAALLLADELEELRTKTGAGISAAIPATAPGVDPEQLEALALRLENCASALEG